MKTDNRVFFQSEKDAIALGFRPCGQCMKSAYIKWIRNKKIY
jgi:methylphosphotriester-DNA--protein-cysteine methyltransferase